MWEKIKSFLSAAKDFIMLAIIGVLLIIVIILNLTKGKKNEKDAGYTNNVPSNTDRIRGAFDKARDRIRDRIKNKSKSKTNTGSD